MFDSLFENHEIIYENDAFDKKKFKRGAPSAVNPILVYNFLCKLIEVPLKWCLWLPIISSVASRVKFATTIDEYLSNYIRKDVSQDTS